MNSNFQDNFYKLVGTKITNYRKERKMSQAAFATRLGLSRSSIVNIELGRQHTPPHVLWQIAQVFALPINELFPSKEELDIFSSNPTLIQALKTSSVSNSNQKSISDFINKI